MNSDSESHYRVEGRDARFLLVDESGETIMACGDERNAEHYAVLMKQAYRKGYKTGYKTGKRPSADSKDTEGLA
jgi:hypothetical protein